MKQLTCEMCGSTNWMKQDGVFVCQTCGMKYSLEDAKKMMSESSAEGVSVVTTTSDNPISNLWQLAQNAYDSKNYAQAEDFCNQILAINADTYEAWKLKGEAINSQITGTNDRIAEVFNCILTSYRVLDEDGKNAHRGEILASIRVCLESEIDFVLELLKNNRPTEDLVEKVTNTFPKCVSDILTAYSELGYSKEDAESYKVYIRNYYTKAVNTYCEDAWKNQVYYNYKRNGWNKEFHPTREITSTYLNEGANLIMLLTNTAAYFDNTISKKEQLQNCQLRIDFVDKLKMAISYKLMEYTTTNGYGAVINSYTKWEIDTVLSYNDRVKWDKLASEAHALADQIEVSMAREDPAMRTKMIQKWTAQRNAIPTGLDFSSSWIFAVLLWAAIAYCSFAYLDALCKGFEWLSTVIGVVFSVGALICAVCAISELSKSKKRQQANLRERARINKKIEEFTQSTAGTPNQNIPAPPQNNT